MISEETRQKLRLAKLGKKQPQSQIEKRVLKLMGNKSRTGQHQSPEERLKKSLALKGRVKTPEHLKKIADALRGKKHPERSGANHPNWKGGSDMKNIKNKERVAGRKKPEQCEVCGALERIMFDHDHETGKFRGWICGRCNTALGMVKDNAETLMALSNYLIKSRQPPQ
jgi:hypothetical protein